MAPEASWPRPGAQLDPQLASELGDLLRDLQRALEASPAQGNAGLCERIAAARRRLMTAVRVQQSPADAQVQRAFEIADDSMVQLVMAHGLGCGVPGTWKLVDAAQHQVAALDEADPPLAEAVRWLAPRGLVTVERERGFLVARLADGLGQHERESQRG